MCIERNTMKIISDTQGFGNKKPSYTSTNRKSKDTVDFHTLLTLLKPELEERSGFYPPPRVYGIDHRLNRTDRPSWKNFNGSVSDQNTKKPSRLYSLFMWIMKVCGYVKEANHTEKGETK
jgi:hypothetical protein